jgi:hypothetical protein
VTNLSWSVDVRTHAIAKMVDMVLSEPWPAANDLGLEVPPLKRQDDCLVSYRVPSHKAEPFSHWHGVAAGLLQMGLWKLQLMNKQHFSFGMLIHASSQKHHYAAIRSDTINLVSESIFVTDGRTRDEKELRGCTLRPFFLRLSQATG